MSLWFINPRRKKRSRKNARTLYQGWVRAKAKSGYTHKSNPRRKYRPVAWRKPNARQKALMDLRKRFYASKKGKVTKARNKTKATTKAWYTTQSNPRKSRKGKRKSMSKLYGAAKKARNKRLAKARRKRNRKNPSYFKRRKGGAKGYIKRSKARTRARAKARMKARARGPFATGGTKRFNIKKTYNKIWSRSKAARKRKKRKGSSMAKKGTKAARKRAARKAAKTRAAKHAKRSRAAKKAARTRKRRGGSRKARKGGRKMARRYRRKFKRLSKRGRTKRGGRGVRSLVRARRAVRYTKRHGSGRARRYMKRYRMHLIKSNPLALIKQIMKDVLPVAVGLFAARAIGANVGRVPAVDGLLAKAGSAEPLARAVLVGGVMYAATISKSPLSKYRNAAMVGAGLNLVMAAVNAFAPDSVKGYIGAGDVSYDMAGYQSDMANYEQVGSYEEVGNYEEVGGWADGLTKGVGRHSALKQLASRGMQDDVPDFSEDDVGEGIFAGSGWCVN